MGILKVWRPQNDVPRLVDQAGCDTKMGVVRFQINPGGEELARAWRKGRTELKVLGDRYPFLDLEVAVCPLEHRGVLVGGVHLAIVNLFGIPIRRRHNRGEEAGHHHDRLHHCGRLGPERVRDAQRSVVGLDHLDRAHFDHEWFKALRERAQSIAPGGRLVLDQVERRCVDRINRLTESTNNGGVHLLCNRPVGTVSNSKGGRRTHNGRDPIVDGRAVEVGKGCGGLLDRVPVQRQRRRRHWRVAPPRVDRLVVALGGPGQPHPSRLLDGVLVLWVCNQVAVWPKHKGLDSLLWRRSAGEVEGAHHVGALRLGRLGEQHLDRELHKLLKLGLVALGRAVVEIDFKRLGGAVERVLLVLDRP